MRHDIFPKNSGPLADPRWGNVVTRRKRGKIYLVARLLYRSDGPVRTVQLRERVSESFIIRNVTSGLKQLFGSKSTTLALLFILFLFVIGIFAPNLAPYDPAVTHYNADGEVLRATGPSVAHPLGTTSLGYDVLSRMIIGSQATLLTGFLGGTMIVTIGLTVGVTAGYLGGTVDTVLMRFTDIVYTIPLLIFGIVLLAYVDPSLFTTILVIGSILWRSSARVLRSQVLQIKQRPYIEAAKATGASTPRIIIKHILPNIAPLGALFFALGAGWAILLQAGLAFVGVTDPFVPSWGIMIRNAYNSGYMADQLAWTFAPGIMISFTVASLFLVGRKLGGENTEPFE